MITILRNPSTNQIHGHVSAILGDKTFECLSLERPWNNNRKETSCLIPPPGQNGTISYYIINQHSNFPIIQLGRTGRIDRRIQVFPESPIWLGRQKVWSESFKRYEFTDFRQTLRELATFIPEEGFISFEWGEPIQQPDTKVITGTNFYYDEDERYIAPLSEPGYSD